MERGGEVEKRGEARQGKMPQSVLSLESPMLCTWWPCSAACTDLTCFGERERERERRER
jgi:hypothetical protein